MPVSSRSLRHVFSLRKQANIGTEVADAHITQMRGDTDFAPFTMERRAEVHNQGFFGQPSQFASFNEILGKSYLLNSRQRPASDVDCLWALSYVMGGLAFAASTPVVGAEEHTITFVDPEVTPEMHYTSIVENFGGTKLKFEGLWLDQVQLSGTFGDFIKVGFSGGARNLETATTAIPTAVTAGHLYQINRTVMKLNTAPTETVIDGKWVGFDLTINSNPDVKLRSGQPVGEEELIHRVDRGDQTVTGNIQVEFETAFSDLFRNATQAYLEIEMISKDIITGTTPYSMKLIFPEVVFQAESFSEEGRTTILQLDIAEQSVLDSATANTPMAIEIITDIDNTDILVVTS